MGGVPEPVGERAAVWAKTHGKVTKVVTGASKASERGLVGSQRMIPAPVKKREQKERKTVLAASQLVNAGSDTRYRRRRRVREKGVRGSWSRRPSSRFAAEGSRGKKVVC